MVIGIFYGIVEPSKIAEYVLELAVFVTILVVTLYSVSNLCHKNLNIKTVKINKIKQITKFASIIYKYTISYIVNFLAILAIVFCILIVFYIFIHNIDLLHDKQLI